MEISTKLNISFLIAFNEGCSETKKNWNWNKQRYNFFMKSNEFIYGNCKNNYYNFEEQINNNFNISKNEIIVITNSNIVFDFNLINEVIPLLKKYSYVKPYQLKNLISKNDTINIIKNSHTQNIDDFVFDADMPGITSDDLIITTRERFKKIGGLDEYNIEWDYSLDFFLQKLVELFGPYAMLIRKKIWSLYYPKVDYPSYGSGVNLTPLINKKDQRRGDFF